MAKLLTTDNKTEDISPANGKTFQLDELQKLVDGYIEVVEIENLYEYNGTKLMVINEDGMMKRKIFNIRASTILGLPVMGDVVIIDKSELE